MPKKALKIVIELLFIGIILSVANRFVSEEIKSWLEKQLNQNFASNPKLKSTITWIVITAVFLLYVLYKLWTDDTKKPDYKILKDNRKELLENLEYVYDNALKVKLHNDLKHKIDVILKYSKEGTTEDFVKDDFIPGFDEHQLADFTELYDAVETKISRLLILGEPGSGKSTLLLQFAKKLIAGAKKDENHPIPVLLNLSSWSYDYKSFEDWLENNLEGLSGIFSISKSYSHSLANSKQLILLLDGFDEISEPHRLHFFYYLKVYLNKIAQNEWLGTQLVLCSRIEEYVQIERNAPVQAAVKIQPIKADKVIELLKDLSEHNPIRKNSAEKLLNEIGLNDKLPQLINTAFYLNIALNITKTKLESCHTEKQLLDAYVNEQLAKLSDFYPRKIVVRTLHWLSLCQQKHKLGLKFELSNINANWAKYQLICILIFSQIILFLMRFGVTKLAPLNHYKTTPIATSAYLMGCLITFGLFYFFTSNQETVVATATKIGYKHIYKRDLIYSSISFLLIIPLINIRSVINILSNQPLGALPEQVVANVVLGLAVYLLFLLNGSSPLPFQKTPLSRFKLAFQSSMTMTAFVATPVLLTMLFMKAFSLTSFVFILPAVIIFGIMLFSGLLLYLILYISVKLENRIPFNLIRFLNGVAEKTGLLEKEGAKWRFKHLLVQDWFLHRI